MRISKYGSAQVAQRGTRVLSVVADRFIALCVQGFHRYLPGVALFFEDPSHEPRIALLNVICSSVIGWTPTVTVAAGERNIIFLCHQVMTQHRKPFTRIPQRRSPQLISRSSYACFR